MSIFLTTWHAQQMEEARQRASLGVALLPSPFDLKRAEVGMKKSGVFWEILVEWAEKNRNRSVR